MTCPVCGGAVHVLSCRSDDEVIVRRRECKDCCHVFYTTEYEAKDSFAEFVRIQNEYNHKYFKEVRSKK